MRRAWPLLLAVLSVSVAACDDAATHASPSATPPSSARPASTSSARAAPSSAASSATTANGRTPVEVLRFTLASDVKNKEPVDELTAAEAGMRVYAHLAVRSRIEGKRRLTVVFRVDGEDRSSIVLSTEKSWRWRTWGYSTVRANDTGDLSVDVIDDTETVIATAKIPIKAKQASKAPPTSSAKDGKDSDND